MQQFPFEEFCKFYETDKLARDQAIFIKGEPDLTKIVGSFFQSLPYAAKLHMGGAKECCWLRIEPGTQWEDEFGERDVSVSFWGHSRSPIVTEIKYVREPYDLLLDYCKFLNASISLALDTLWDTLEPPKCHRAPVRAVLAFVAGEVFDLEKPESTNPWHSLTLQPQAQTSEWGGGRFDHNLPRRRTTGQWSSRPARTVAGFPQPQNT